MTTGLPAPPPCPSFGTDGIRGLTGKDITAALMYRLGLCAAEVLAPAQGVLTGWDGRCDGDELEASFAEGVCAGGGKVWRCGRIPSGMLGMLAGLRADMDGAAVVTASHNPAEYNGIKFYGRSGAKLSRATEAALLKTWPGQTKRVSGTSHTLADDEVLQPIVTRLSTHLDGERPLQGLSLVVDCANGAATPVAEPLLEQLGARVRTIHRDGRINDRCGAAAPADLARAVAEDSADYGIALDGDGDRLLLLDRNGRSLDGDHLLMLQSRLEKLSGLAGTVMTNTAVELAMREQKVAFARADVGEVPLLTLMQERGWQIGGEPSGHLLDLRLHRTADGLTNAICLLALLARRDLDAAGLLADFVPFEQVQSEVPCADPGALEDEALQRQLRAFAERLSGDEGRMLVRSSGTEPVVRVMVETRDRDWSRALVGELCTLLSGQLKADAQVA